MAVYKSNLTLIAVFFFIPVDYLYADNPNEMQVLQMRNSECVGKLAAKGFIYRRYGLDNYMPLFKDFTEKNGSKYYYTHLSHEIDDACSEKIWGEFGSKYCIYLVHRIYEIFRNQKGFDQISEYWCFTRNIKGGPNIMIKCESDIKEDGFIYYRGIDNYALYLLKKKEDVSAKVESNELKVFSSLYVKFLQNEAQLYSDGVAGTGFWCCQYSLNDIGFTDPTEGSFNYEVISLKLDGNCNKLLKGIEHSYCIYLINNYSLNIKANRLLLGTDEWCEQYIRFQYQTRERKNTRIFS